MIQTRFLILAVSLFLTHSATAAVDGFYREACDDYNGTEDQYFQSVCGNGPVCRISKNLQIEDYCRFEPQDADGNPIDIIIEKHVRITPADEFSEYMIRGKNVTLYGEVIGRQFGVHVFATENLVTKNNGRHEGVIRNSEDGDVTLEAGQNIRLNGKHVLLSGDPGCCVGNLNITSTHGNIFIGNQTTLDISTPDDSELIKITALNGGIEIAGEIYADGGEGGDIFIEANSALPLSSDSIRISGKIRAAGKDGGDGGMIQIRTHAGDIRLARNSLISTNALSSDGEFDGSAGVLNISVIPSEDPLKNGNIIVENGALITGSASGDEGIDSQIFLGPACDIQIDGYAKNKGKGNDGYNYIFFRDAFNLSSTGKLEAGTSVAWGGGNFLSTRANHHDYQLLGTHLPEAVIEVDSSLTPCPKLPLPEPTPSPVPVPTHTPKPPQEGCTKNIQCDDGDACTLNYCSVSENRGTCKTLTYSLDLPLRTKCHLENMDQHLRELGKILDSQGKLKGRKKVKKRLKAVQKGTSQMIRATEKATQKKRVKLTRKQRKARDGAALYVCREKIHDWLLTESDLGMSSQISEGQKKVRLLRSNGKRRSPNLREKVARLLFQIRGPQTQPAASMKYRKRPKYSSALEETATIHEYQRAQVLLEKIDTELQLFQQRASAFKETMCATGPESALKASQSARKFEVQDQEFRFRNR